MCIKNYTRLQEDGAYWECVDAPSHSLIYNMRLHYDYRSYSGYCTQVQECYGQ